MLTKDLDGPLDDCSDLDAGQSENLQGWIERFDEKVSPDGRWGRTCIGYATREFVLTMSAFSIWS